MTTIQPFLKWAGGKRWLVLADEDLPEFTGRYFEPFLGSAAVYFRLLPTSATLSDTNAELINAYRAIQKDWQRVAEALFAHHQKHSREHYYRVRSQRLRNSFTRAARFIYLNRTCWNGLYRVNLRGDFNVPLGLKTTVFDSPFEFETIAAAIQGATIECSDFESIIDRAEEGDLIFADPPYTVEHNCNGFVKYNEHLFSWADQIRLRNTLLRATGRGASVYMTNANHPSVVGLYKEKFQISTVQRWSKISGARKKASLCDELVIRHP